MSDSLQPHGLYHTRLPCPSSIPGACSNSCPSSWWCHPTISSSVIPFSSCLQSFLASAWVSPSHQVAKVLVLQHQSFQWIFRIDFLWDWLVWSPCSPRDSQESSPKPQFKTLLIKVNRIVMFSCSVLSDSLWPHGLQHARLPCLSPSPRACSNSCPLSQWCHPTISSSFPFLPAFNLSQHEGLF